MSALAFSAGIVTVMAAIGLSVFYFYQEKLIFFPEILHPDFKFEFAENFDERSIQLQSGGRVSYLVFRPESRKGAILYFRGNAGSLKNWGFAAAELAAKTGWGVWIMDYPGCGKSSGPLPKTERVLIEMGRALRSEINRATPMLPLVLFGRSIGSGIATTLAMERAPAGLILEAPYLSLAKLGREIYPFLPESFSRFDLDNKRGLAGAGPTPTLILHGTRDSVIPFYHGQQLAELADQARLVAIAGGNHNDLADFPDYWMALTSFLPALAARNPQQEPTQ